MTSVLAARKERERGTSKVHLLVWFFCEMRRKMRFWKKRKVAGLQRFKVNHTWERKKNLCANEMNESSRRKSFWWDEQKLELRPWKETSKLETQWQLIKNHYRLLEGLIMGVWSSVLDAESQAIFSRSCFDTMTPFVDYLLNERRGWASTSHAHEAQKTPHCSFNPFTEFSTFRLLLVASENLEWHKGSGAHFLPDVFSIFIQFITAWISSFWYHYTHCISINSFISVAQPEILRRRIKKNYLCIIIDLQRINRLEVGPENCSQTFSDAIYCLFLYHCK